MRVGQLNRAVKADEISVVEPTQPLRLARQSKETIERLGLCPSLFDLEEDLPWLVK